MTTAVSLREVVADDLPVFFEQQWDPVANEMAAFPARERDAFMAHWTKIAGDETVITRTVVVDGKVAGNVVCWEREGERAVGYWLGKEYWGRGVATAAVSAFLQLVSARPLVAHVAVHNLASIRVLQKCGFTISARAAVDSGGPGGDVDEFVMMLE